MSWQRVRLKDLLHPIRRAVTIEPFETYRILGVHWYGDGLFIKEEKLGHEIKAKMLYEVVEGDFVYNRLFAWKGSFALAGAEHDGCFVSNEFPCFEVDSQVDARFLVTYFRQPSSWNEALGLSTGSTPTSRNRLKEEHFLNLEIPLPPLAEQLRIVSLQAKIETAKRLHAEAEKELEVLMYSVLSKALTGKL